MRMKICVVCFLAILMLPACYQMVKKNAGLMHQGVSPEVDRYLLLLEKKNKAVSNFKAIGKVRLWDGPASRTSRAAWLGTTNGRLRIEFLGLPGQPVAKFIYDGHRFSFISGIDQQVYERKSADPDLKPVTGVSVKTSELLTCLGGGIPIYEYDSAFLERGEDLKENVVLVLEKTWLGVVEKIFFNGSDIGKMEVFRWGKKVYQAVFDDIRPINHARVPFVLSISNGEGRGFSFIINRYWGDIDIPPAAFNMNPAN